MFTLLFDVFIWQVKVYKQEVKIYCRVSSFRVYSELDQDVPEFPDDFQVAKYAIFKQVCFCFVVVVALL